jgi:hypothetical protein
MTDKFEVQIGLDFMKLPSLYTDLCFKQVFEMLFSAVCHPAARL